MHAKLLVDTGATLAFMSKTLFETIPQVTRPRLQNSKQNFLAANGIMTEPYASGPPKVSFFSPPGLFFHQKRQLLFDNILNVGEETKIIYPGTVIGQLSEVKDDESSYLVPSGKTASKHCSPTEKYVSSYYILYVHVR